MLPIALTTGAIAVVWLTIFIRFLGLFGASMALVIVASCFGYDFYHVKAGPFPLSADRLMLVGLVGLYLVQLRLRIVRSKPLHVTDVLFGIYLAILAASTMLHDWRWRDSQPLASLLFLYFCPATLYWVVRESYSGERCIRGFLALIAGFGVYVSLTAVAEVTEFYSVVFPRYIATSTNTEWFGRARGPFLNPTTNGMFLSAALFAWAMFWPRSRGIGRLVVLAGMGTALLGVYCTLTRSCWIGAGCGLAIIVFSSLNKQVRIPAIVITCLVACVLLTVGKESLTSFKRDKNVSQFEMEQSAKLRPVLAAVAWRIFKDHPLFGAGYGQYKHVDLDYLRDPTSDLPLEIAKGYVQHNLFFSIAVDMGLLGLCAYVAILAGWSWHGWQLWCDSRLPLLQRQIGLFLLAVIAQWCINGLFHDISLPTNSNMLLFATAAVCQGAWLSRPS